MPSLKPVVRSNGISSQDGGAQELPGSYTTRPIQHQVGKVGSFATNPLMGQKPGVAGDTLGKANGRKTK
jgi:hypothetical protein